MSEESKRLCTAVKSDITDRKEWYDCLKEQHDDRMRCKARRRAPYPGAPNLVEPLIDDNIVAITSSETSILWSARNLATFLPLTTQGYQYKSLIERGFDTLLRINLDLRAKVENLFDTKNEWGMGIAKLVVNTDAIPGDVLPDFEPIDPRDVVVPKGTRNVRDADRVTCIYRYTEREFKAEARERGWDKAAVKQVLESFASDENSSRDVGPGGEHSSLPDQPEYGASRSAINDEDNTADSESQIAVWYVYHWKESDGRQRKYVTVFNPDRPDLVLDSYLWSWPDEPVEIQDVDEFGQPFMRVEMIPGEDRRWPLVQFRYENRSLQYYDTRGVAAKLKNDQREATANKNAKALIMDYTAKPFLKGATGNLKTFRWRPGEQLPPNAELVIPPRVDPIFDYNMDMARRSAARRVGAPQGAFSSADTSKDSKTATEVSYTALTSNRLSSDAVERFAEPLGELFQMMWEFMVKFPPRSLMAVNGADVRPVPLEAFAQPYIVVPGISGRSANPDLVLRQIFGISQAMNAFPQAQPFVKGQPMAQFLFDQIDPKLTPHLVVTGEGGGTAPIEQQMQQVIQTLTGNDQQRGLVEQAHSNSQMLSVLAQESLARDQQDELATRVRNRAPAAAEGQV